MASTRNTPSKIYDIQAHSAKVSCLDIGQKGPVLVTGGQDRNVNLWTFGNENCLLSLTGHNAALECVKFAYCDDFVYSSDSLGVIKRWDLVNNSCSTFYGHMKPVKTIDMHPTSNQYFVSGSNDTVIILWDVRTESAMKRYRGHMANVNSVKFSPDGFWIASAGSEGAVTIWDIRMSKQIMEFVEPKISPALCVQYHPEHLLMACGRNDGTVDLYDLEEKKLITRLDKTSSMGSAIKCLTFDESGGCLFAGTANGVSVIGWEPDEEFDHVESTWSLLGDIKILANKLYCGGYDMNRAQIYDLKLSHIKPFYNPMNTSFIHNQSSRKSFSRGNGKMHLSIGSPTKSDNFAMDEEHTCTSPEISIEFESIKDENQPMMDNPMKFVDPNAYNFDDLPLQIQMPHMPQMITQPIQQSQPLVNSNPFVRKEMEMYNLDSDLDYYPCKNVSSDPEKEDFPVNNAQPPDYAPKLTTMSSATVTKTVVSRQKLDTQQVRRPSPPNMNAIKTGLPRKMSNASRSTLELNKIGQDDLHHHATTTFKKPMSRGTSPVRNYATLNNKIRKSESSAQINNVKNTQNRFSHHPSTNGTKIEIYAKPVRSKTVYDMKSVMNTAHISHQTSHLHHIASLPGMQMQMQMPLSSGPNSIPLRYPSELTTNEEYEIITMMNGHETVHPKLSSRATQLSFIRNMTQKGEINGALKMAALNDKMPDSNILVDLLGTILEQSSTMNLDMCVILLPKIHEVLYNGENKFHCARACETLRIILQTFLPIIRENTYGGCAIGVDVSREERVNKCKECREWLLRIRCLPEKSSMNAKILQHVKSMIVDI